MTESIEIMTELSFRDAKIKLYATLSLEEETIIL